MISDETEKRKIEVREKIKEYLKDRQSLGVAKNPKKKVYDDEEEIDGALID